MTGLSWSCRSGVQFKRLRPAMLTGRKRLLAQGLLVELPVVFIWRIAIVADVAQGIVACPVVGVVPGAFEAVRNEESIVVEADIEVEGLFAADAAVRELLIAFAARTAIDCREGAAVGTAHGELLYAVA